MIQPAKEKVKRVSAHFSERVIPVFHDMYSVLPENDDFFRKKQSRQIRRLRFLLFAVCITVYLQPQPSPHPQQLNATRIGMMLQPEPQLLKPLPPQQSNRRIIQRQSQPPDIPHSLKLFMFVPPI